MNIGGRQFTDPPTQMALQVRAHRRVYHALRTGKLVRPDRCPRCGYNPGVRRDGRSLMQAHHRDYTRPLEVEWCCPWCHPIKRACGADNGAYTHPERVLRGVKHGRAKLTDDDVREIRRRAVGEHLTGYRLSLLYNIDRKNIGDILSGKIWRHLL